MKKRILTAIIAAVICIMSIFPVFANETGVYFTPYDITVASESGAVLYDVVWNDDMTRSILRPMTVLAPVGTQLVVLDEIEFNGELYFAVEYKDFFAYIKSSKALINVQNVGEEAAYPTASERSVIIINKAGTPLRKGPSLAYDTATEAIPYGTVVSYQAVNCEEEAYAQWAYTEHNGVKGWLYICQYGLTSNFDCAVVLDGSSNYTGSLKVLTDGAFLTEAPDPASAKTAEGIPAGTTLSFRYYYEFYDSISAFVEYNGTKGWLRTKTDSAQTATGEKGGIYVLSKNGLPLYTNAFEESAEPAAIVPEGTNLCVDYVYRDAGQSDGEIVEYKWMHTNYNGTDGWIFSADASEYCYMLNAFDLKITAEGGVAMQTAPYDDSEEISVIPKGTTVTCVYEISETKDAEKFYWSYVEHGGKQGWIHNAEEEATYIEGSEKQLDAPFGAQPLEAEKSADAPELVTKPDSSGKNDTEEKSPSTAVIIISVCAGVAVAAAIIVAVVKKKKS